MPSDTFTVVMGEAPGNPELASQVKPTQPYPFVPVKETRYYACARPAAKMERTDGFAISFLAGIHETNNFHTIRFLDNEIAGSHPEVREAGAAEIEEYLYRKDPKGFMRKQTTAEVEAGLATKLATLVAIKLQSLGSTELLSAEQILELMASSNEPAGEPVDNSDERKLAGVDPAAALRERFAGLRSGSAILSNATNTANSAT